MLKNRLRTYASREDGFTLIELLIVVLIIGVLAAIAIPVYLGIQNQSYKSVVKADVNTSVKRVQVALTEGAAIGDVKANYADYGVKASQPKIGEVVYLANSPSANASTRDYQVVGSMDKTATPNAAPINYTYTYDSFTGKFGEADTASSTPQIVLGSGTGTLPDGYTGTQYTAQIDATVTGGTGTTQYTVTAGSLPAGYTLNQSTGAISGNTSAAGTYPITVTVTNGNLTSNRAYVLRVYTKPVITSSTTLPAGVVGEAYSQTITATGNPTPTFARTSGTLPAGLTLDPTTGVIAGNPTTVGTSSFTVTASNAGGDSTPQSYTIVVNQAPSITTTSLNGSVIGNAAYSQTVAATGNPAPTFTATGLPTGMSINSSTGEITGSATGTATTYNVNVTATNAARSDSKSLTLFVGSNILTNPGFENAYSTSPWTTNGTTGIAAHLSSENMTCPANNNAVIKGQGNDNGYLLMYSGNAGTYATVLQDVSTTVITGKTYTGGAYVAGCSNASQAGTLYIVEFNNGNQVGLTATPYSVGSGWNYVSTSYTATGPGTNIRLQFVPNSGQGNILLDNASLGVTN